MQIKEESLPQAWGRLIQLLNALPDHPLKKNEILDIIYNGLTDASKDYLDSCVGCVFRERTVGDITICVSLPGGAGLRKEDSPERSPRPKYEDGGS